MSTSSEPTPSRADITYPQPNKKDNTLDEQKLHRTCPLDVGRHQLKPEYDLGGLDKLPYELIADILAQLDLRSLFDFRRVSQRAMQAVDGMPDFKQIAKHHLTIVRALLAVEAGTHLSCVNVLEALKSPNCIHCGDFAGYIYALNCSRVCFLCFTERQEYLPLTALWVYRMFGVDLSHLSSTPRLKCLPGRYSQSDKPGPRRLVLYDAQSAKQMGLALHGSQAAMTKFAIDAAWQESKQYKPRFDRWRKTASAPKPRRPRGEEKEYDGKASNRRRFMGVAIQSRAFIAQGVDESIEIV
ncbi:hypothetical protein PRZ48_009446 [Zasmidium cellare]|uniref:F-box domain-containing protein n=1 Tax=Zasmidium cellare TaxID=395010 RepID=A0ABR0ECE5_ZASCE|nr:hypothetical protein PRZ48_009446 [Zasmidium cellare]